MLAGSQVQNDRLSAVLEEMYQSWENSMSRPIYYSQIKPSQPQMSIQLLPFLRTMAVLLWSALRHPFKTTEIDLSTGKVVRHY